MYYRPQNIDQALVSEIRRIIKVLEKYCTKCGPIYSPVVQYFKFKMLGAPPFAGTFPLNQLSEAQSEP